MSIHLTHVALLVVGVVLLILATVALVDFAWQRMNHALDVDLDRLDTDAPGVTIWDGARWLPVPVFDDCPIFAETVRTTGCTEVVMFAARVEAWRRP